MRIYLIRQPNYDGRFTHKSVSDRTISLKNLLSDVLLPQIIIR